MIEEECLIPHCGITCKRMPGCLKAGKACQLQLNTVQNLLRKLLHFRWSFRYELRKSV